LRVKGSGTIVLWQGLSRLVDETVTSDDSAAQAQFLDAVARVEKHLALTFGRFLGGGGPPPRRRTITLTGNSGAVNPWDPCMESHDGTLPRPVEHLQLDGHDVVVRPYVLPPKRRLTDEQYRAGGGPRGWLEQQGLYIYRNNRLIVPGDWLDLPGFRKD